jgi:multidrug efflux pump subunit AcrA (membrane-fusion protein)
MLETHNSSENLSFEAKKSQHQGFKLKKSAIGMGSIALLVSGWTIGKILPSQPNLKTQNLAQTRSIESLLTVKTVKIQSVKSYKTKTTYTGEVKASRSSELGFERAGKLVWVGVDRGDRVKQGQAIARLDSSNLDTQRLQLVAQKEKAVAVLEELQNGARQEDIAEAKAQVKDLEEQLNLEKIKRDRREYLVREGASAREDFDELSYGSKALSERLEAAKSNLNELLAGTRKEQITAQKAAVRELEAQIKDIEITIAKSTIKSPFSGTIAARKLDEGVVIEPGQAIVRLIEDIKPEIEIGIPVAIASELQIGSFQKVETGQKTFSAKLISILPEVNVSTRTRTAILKLDRSPNQVPSGWGVGGRVLGVGEIAKSKDIPPFTKVISQKSARSTLDLSPQQIARLELVKNIATDGYWLPIAALSKGERGLWSCYVAVKKGVGGRVLGVGEQEIKSWESKERVDKVEKQDVEVLYGEGDRVLVRGTLQPGDRVIVEGVQRVVPGQLIKSEVIQAGEHKSAGSRGEISNEP